MAVQASHGSDTDILSIILDIPGVMESEKWILGHEVIFDHGRDHHAIDRRDDASKMRRSFLLPDLQEGYVCLLFQRDNE